MQIPFAEIRVWMFEHALPLWAEQGFDNATGCPLEELPAAGMKSPNALRRTRAICRQVYVYAHAQQLGWSGGGVLAERACDFLMRHAWQGAQRGWARRLAPAGAVIDPTPDLYDTAFVLFALAWRHRVSPDRAVLTRMHETVDFLHAHMRWGRGFAHELPPQGPRQQNPHMHLFEASLAAFDATQDQRFLDLAAEMHDLFRECFFDGRTLAEFFDNEWQRAPGEVGRIVEPGHQFEWAWILVCFATLSGRDVTTSAQALVGFAEQYGVDPATQATFQQVRDDGAPLDRSSRSWPNTERIKGHLALFELTGADPRAPVAGAARVLLDRYLAVEPRGAWIDHFDAAGGALATTIPASTFYHVFLAFAEVLRLEPRLSGGEAPL